jgi:ABC-2 type transport system ATP-binding protein
MPDFSIEVIDLTHYYNSHPAVDQISFTVQRGQILGLLGPNGAGKSTILKILTTLLPPTLGTAKISGYDIVHEAPLVRQHIGYVPQLLSADGDLTAYENLLLSTKLYGLPNHKRKRRIKELLEFMGLSEFADQLVNQFSGGMIRRLEIAQALVHEPHVLFFDEPTVGLDPAARRVVWNRIMELRKQFGTTILMTTHDMEEADTLCDIVAFMHLGHILKMNSPHNLKKELGPKATLNDVFIQLTGTSITAGDIFNHAKQIRQTLSHLD